MPPAIEETAGVQVEDGFPIVANSDILRMSTAIDHFFDPHKVVFGTIDGRILHRSAQRLRADY